jgi:hypothetical protein
MTMATKVQGFDGQQCVDRLVLVFAVFSVVWLAQGSVPFSDEHEQLVVAFFYNAGSHEHTPKGFVRARYGHPRLFALAVNE